MSSSSLNKVWLILQYFYCKLPFMKWMIGAGFFIFLLKFWTISFSPNLTFALSLVSLFFIFLIPFMASCAALRELISKERLVLIPGFNLMAGISLLLMIVPPCFWWSLNAWHFGNEVFSFMPILRSFICLSLFALVMQLILPSRYYVQIISLLPVSLFLVILQFQSFFSSAFYNDTIVWSLFVVSILGWGLGLYYLNTRHQFKPPYQQLMGLDYWSYDGGLYQRKAIGKSSSASGTLLLGYPDGWKGILTRIANYMVITPLITVLFFYVIGFGQEFEFPVSQSLFGIFLIISLSSACACISIFGEMAARCRLIWLRKGSNRESQWQILEHLTLRIFFSYLLIAGIITVISLVYSMLPKLMSMHYFLIICSFCTFTMYLSLGINVYNWSTILQAIIVIIVVTIMVFGMIVSIGEKNYLLLGIIEASYFGAGLMLRLFIRKKFLNIDWFKIKYKRSTKLVTS